MASIGEDPFETLSKVRKMGFSVCQLGNPPDEYVYGENRDELNSGLRKAVQETGVEIASIFIMYKGHIWDLENGPRTIGLVPEDTRASRVVHACMMSNWARKIGIDTVTSHMGFIPRNAKSSVYKGFIETMKGFIAFCADNGQTFAFETGQEPPYVLRRTIEDIGLNNIGVNLDAANVLMYGMGSSEEAVDLLGEFVVNTHCKDGKMPQEEGKLGPETPLGEGNANYERLIPALYRKGYRGPLTIEREISGEKQTADILTAKKTLERIRQNLITGVCQS